MKKYNINKEIRFKQLILDYERITKMALVRSTTYFGTDEFYLNIFYMDIMNIFRIYG
jgi:hypothetical protein